MKVLVTGAAGQLGAEIVREFSRRHEVAAFDRGALDITDADAIGRQMEAVRPDVVINCAADNRVDAAEDDPLPAFAVNAAAVWELARAAESGGAVFVHFSTDFVFDGETDQPYREDDPPRPLNLYSASKLAGEHLARIGCARTYLCRVESVFGMGARHAPPRNSVDRIIGGLLDGAPPRVITDRVISPTYAVDAARAVEEMLVRRIPPGIYHVANEGTCTWAELGRRLAEVLKASVRSEEVPMAAMHFKARRPRYSALDVSKLRAAGIEMPRWEDAIQRFVSERLHG